MLWALVYLSFGFFYSISKTYLKMCVVYYLWGFAGKRKKLNSGQVRLLLEQFTAEQCVLVPPFSFCLLDIVSKQRKTRKILGKALF